jgi:hypothetical protein
MSNPKSLRRSKKMVAFDSLSPRDAETAKRNAANCVAAKEELLT